MEWIKTGLEATKAGEKLLEGALSLVNRQYSLYSSVEENVGRLRITVKSINAILKDAEERREITDEAVTLWLSRLKSIAFDSNDLLDYHETALATYKQSKRTDQSGEGPSKKRKWFLVELPVSISFPSFSLGPKCWPLHRRRIAIEIEEIEKRLAFITENRNNIGLRNDDGVRREARNERKIPSQQGSSQDPAKIVGREEELDAIVKVLTADLGEASGSTPTIPVVAIQGTAGLGKTTLARLVYHDNRVQSYFKVWVDMTDGSDVTSVTKEIYEKMTRQRCDDGNLGTIQDLLRDYLKKHLQSSKFLIVIDNLWEESFHFWENLRVPLLAGKRGSKVLITTRNEYICRLISPMLHLINLKSLEDKHCWHLFHAFAFLGIEGRDELVQVGMEIAKNCYGSPLAAKTLGALLNGKDEEQWQNVLDELHVLEQDKNGTLRSLHISYRHLPYDIKKCFAYCCIFPNGYLFEKDQLIRYWLAEGLIPFKGRRRLEHIGTTFFDELLWTAFFEKVPLDDKSKGEKYRMPSLMQELARSISKYEFVDLHTTISKTESEAGHFRYASLLHRDAKPSSVENAYNFKKIRTLISCSKTKNPLNKIPPELFPTLACLRVLDLGNSELTELPEIDGDQLIHLRYFGLSDTKIKKIPESICKLYNLQTLELKGCTDLVELPEGIRKLVNLRHLGLHIDWVNITDKDSLHMPHGINHLNSLQTLSRFTVASYSDGNCNICELENLDLRGDLCILNIEKVPMQQPGDALNANLQGKQYIENLMLRWNDSAHTMQVQWQHSKTVMQNLQPNYRLRSLWLINYPGTRFPDWIGDVSFSNLEAIRISNCNNFNFLPLLGQLPRLKNLEIHKVPAKIMNTFVGFPSLEHLILLNLPFLERFLLDKEIPKLEKVYISNCPELKELVINQNLHCEINSINCPNMSVTIHVPQD